jgi:hypothetical protein
MFKRLSLSKLFFVIIFFGSCQKDETLIQPQPIVKEVEPGVLNKTILKSASPIDNAIVDVFFTPQLSFNFSIGRPFSLPVGDKLVRYRPVLEIVNLGTTAFTGSWSSDSTQLTLSREEALIPLKDYTLTILVRWEHYMENGWKKVVWEGNELRESKEIYFSTNGDLSAFSLSAENVEYSYPIANQYHFFPEEYPKGYIKLKNGQSYLFESNFENWVELTTPNEPAINVPLSYSNKLISFDIPQTLKPETIYKLRYFNKNKISGDVSLLLEYAVRTSKYKSFLEKISTITFSSTTLRMLQVFSWDVHNLLTNFTIGEYFDDFELQTGSHIVQESGEYISARYSNNLIEFDAQLNGNSWYDNKINPLIYAPWTDANFKPTLSRDTSLVGFKPKKAMYISSDGIKLTQSMIDSNLGAAHIPSGLNRVVYGVAPFCFSDFREFQAQVVKQYGTETTWPREKKLVWEQFPIIQQGHYKFRIKYRLPGGKISSTSQEFTFYNPVL